MAYPSIHTDNLAIPSTINNTQQARQLHADLVSHHAQKRSSLTLTTTPHRGISFAQEKRLYELPYISNAFLVELKKIGLYAPLSYWRSEKDWGTADFDTAYQVINLAKRTQQSLIQWLPFHPSSHNNHLRFLSQVPLTDLFLRLYREFL